MSLGCAVLSFWSSPEPFCRAHTSALNSSLIITLCTEDIKLCFISRCIAMKVLPGALPAYNHLHQHLRYLVTYLCSLRCFAQASHFPPNVLHFCTFDLIFLNHPQYIYPSIIQVSSAPASLLQVISYSLSHITWLTPGVPAAFDAICNQRLVQTYIFHYLNYITSFLLI